MMQGISYFRKDEISNSTRRAREFIKSYGAKGDSRRLPTFADSVDIRWQHSRETSPVSRGLGWKEAEGPACTVFEDFRKSSLYPPCRKFFLEKTFSIVL